MKTTNWRQSSHPDRPVDEKNQTLSKENPLIGYKGFVKLDDGRLFAATAWNLKKDKKTFSSNR